MSDKEIDKIMLSIQTELELLKLHGNKVNTLTHEQVLVIKEALKNE